MFLQNFENTAEVKPDFGWSQTFSRLRKDGFQPLGENQNKTVQLEQRKRGPRCTNHGSSHLRIGACSRLLSGK